MSKLISTLSPGNLVKLNENGKPVKYIFLQYNHYGKGEVVLLRKDTFSHMAFKPDQGNAYNGYNGSALDTFCNVVHPLCLDPVIRGSMVNVPIPTAIGAAYSGPVDAVVVNLYRKGFALSCNEAAGTSSVATEGTAFSYLSGAQANRIAYYDETANAVIWWLRSPNSDSNRAYDVGSSGAVSSYDVYIANYVCPRPALALSSLISVSDSTDAEGCYNVEGAPAGEQYKKVNGVWLRMV